ncbi:glycosyltransferase family 4 protein [Alsobacter sp. SYSU BS001988]
MVGVAGNRSYEFSRLLVQAGHEVHVVTSFQNTTSAQRAPWTSVADGITVHWLPIPYSQKMSFKRRMRAFAQFALRSATLAGSLDADVVFATSGPLSIAIPGIYAAWRQRVPLVFEVRDLWPEGAIQLGVLKNPMLKFLARRLERLVYAYSSHVVALSPGMRDGIMKCGVPAEKITVIPNAADLDLFHPTIDGSAVRRRLGLEGRFSLAYFGTMGLANGLGFVLDCAAELQRRKTDGIVFVLHGDGMERAALERRVAQENLRNVIFSDPVPDKRYVSELAGAVDVCMTIYRNAPVLRTCSPNKLFDALAAGKPILTNMPGWLGDELAVGMQTGVLVQPDDPIDFADKVTWMRDHPDDLKAFSQNARALAVRDFAREKLAAQLEGVLLTAARKPAPVCVQPRTQASG